MAELLSIKEASLWATEYLDKNVTTSNISYLIQYGRIKKNWRQWFNSSNQRRIDRILQRPKKI